MYFSVRPHYIDCERINIEFERKIYNKKENPYQIFSFQQEIAYFDIDFDFAVLELVCRYANVPFPLPLTSFGEVSDSEIHLVGHPEGRKMKEESNVFPRWSPVHDNEIIPYIGQLGKWSEDYFPMVNMQKVDYYAVLLEPPRKIMFHTSFDEGSSGSPGFMVKDEQPCVVLMMSGGTPSCYYKKLFPDYPVGDTEKVEFGFAMSDIYVKMLQSDHQKVRDLAVEIFPDWI